MATPHVAGDEAQQCFRHERKRRVRRMARLQARAAAPTVSAARRRRSTSPRRRARARRPAAAAASATAPAHEVGDRVVEEFLGGRPCRERHEQRPDREDEAQSAACEQPDRRTSPSCGNRSRPDWATEKHRVTTPQQVLRLDRDDERAEVDGRLHPTFQRVEGHDRPCAHACRRRVRPRAEARAPGRSRAINVATVS